MENDNRTLSALKERTHAISQEQWYKAAVEYPSVSLPLRTFEEKVFKVVQKSLARIPGSTNTEATEQELIHLLSQLHWQELYLATACACGIEAAWETFHSQYRGTILKTAMRSAGNASEGQEIADSFLSELFLPSQTGSNEGEKKIGQYSGLGSLEGWIKVVIARQSIDRIRAQKRQIPIEDLEVEPPSLDQSARADSRILEHDKQRALQMVSSGLTEALRQLEPQQRIILQLYYLQQVTLKEIGAFLKVHESTASRTLDRLKTQLLASVSDHLQEKFKIKKAEVRHLIGLARSHIELDLKQILAE